MKIDMFLCVCWSHLFSKSSLSLHFSFFHRWLPKAAMRPLGPESSLHNDCVLVVGVSRPKLAAVFLTVMLISLFLTFHVLYDSAVYSLQVSIKTLLSFYISRMICLRRICLCVYVFYAKNKQNSTRSAPSSSLVPDFTFD